MAELSDPSRSKRVELTQSGNQEQVPENILASRPFPEKKTLSPFLRSVSESFGAQIERLPQEEGAKILKQFGQLDRLLSYGVLDLNPNSKQPFSLRPENIIHYLSFCSVEEHLENEVFLSVIAGSPLSDLFDPTRRSYIKISNANGEDQFIAPLMLSGDGKPVLQVLDHDQYQKIILEDQRQAEVVKSSQNILEKDGLKLFKTADGIFLRGTDNKFLEKLDLGSLSKESKAALEKLFPELLSDERTQAVFSGNFVYCPVVGGEIRILTVAQYQEQLISIIGKIEKETKAFNTCLNKHSQGLAPYFASIEGAHLSAEEHTAVDTELNGHVDNVKQLLTNAQVHLGIPTQTQDALTKVANEMFAAQRAFIDEELSSLVSTPVKGVLLAASGIISPGTTLMALGIGGGMGALQYRANELDGVENLRGFKDTVFDSSFNAGSMAIIFRIPGVREVATGYFALQLMGNAADNYSSGRKHSGDLNVFSLGLIAVGATLSRNKGNQVPGQRIGDIFNKNQALVLEVKNSSGKTTSPQQGSAYEGSNGNGGFSPDSGFNFGNNSGTPRVFSSSPSSGRNTPQGATTQFDFNQVLGTKTSNNFGNRQNGAQNSLRLGSGERPGNNNQPQTNGNLGSPEFELNPSGITALATLVLPPLTGIKNTPVRFPTGLPQRGNGTGNSGTTSPLEMPEFTPGFIPPDSGKPKNLVPDLQLSRVLGDKRDDQGIDVDEDLMEKIIEDLKLNRIDDQDIINELKDFIKNKDAEGLKKYLSENGFDENVVRLCSEYLSEVKNANTSSKTCN